ncbi:MAG TPA: response regulator, partial [Anaeromyxobacteraceae bacterium]|nr:response regulator [Anaeromyxobacteraceae bacterium]
MPESSLRGGSRPGTDPRARAEGGPGAGPRDPAKILVVDDREDNLLAIASVLRAPDHDLVLARSGEDALRFLLQGDCALILLDVQMPGMDGFETARLVRSNERTRAIPIVFMTAISREERFIAKGYAAGAVDYLLKPVDPDLLRSKVASFVELHRAKQEIARQAALLREADRAERERVIEQLELRALRRQQALADRYRRLMDGITHAIVWTIDPRTLACTFVSPSAEALLGVSGAAWLGEGWRDLLPADARDPVVAAVRTVAAGGEATVEHGLVGAAGRVARFRTELRAFPAEEDRGPELRGFSVDVTEARAGEAALSFLARAGGELSRSLDVATTVERAARVAVPFLAEACAFSVEATPDGTPISAAAHADPAQDGIARALAAGELRRAPAASATVVEDVAPPRDAAPPGGGWSALSVPLRQRDRALGTARFFRRAPGFSAHDARLAEEYASRAAQAIENALLYQEARETV